MQTEELKRGRPGNEASGKAYQSVVMIFYFVRATLLCFVSDIPGRKSALFGFKKRSFDKLVQPSYTLSV